MDRSIAADKHYSGAVVESLYEIEPQVNGKKKKQFGSGVRFSDLNDFPWSHNCSNKDTCPTFPQTVPTSGNQML